MLEGRPASSPSVHPPREGTPWQAPGDEGAVALEQNPAPVAGGNCGEDGPPTAAISHWVALPPLTAERELWGKDKPLESTAWLLGPGMR